MPVRFECQTRLNLFHLLLFPRRILIVASNYEQSFPISFWDKCLSLNIVLGHNGLKMSRKRQNTSSPEPDDAPSPKRQDTRDAEDSYDDSWDDSDAEENDETPQVSEYTGQIGAFPGLRSSGNDLFYGPAADGIDYLRMVR